MTTIGNGDLTVGAHSQGTLMTQVGMDARREQLQEIIQKNEDAKFLVQYSGSPVNHNKAEALITDIYGGEQALAKRPNIYDISDVFRSNVTPGDPVASILGYQSAGINSSENVGANMLEGFLNIPSVFGFGNDPSPHSYYPCVIGCGEDNYTPDIKNYYTPNKSDGSKESPRTEYYKDNFTVKDTKTGKPTITINLDLLKSSSQTNDNSPKTVIDITEGK